MQAGRHMVRVKTKPPLHGVELNPPVFAGKHDIEMFFRGVHV